MVIYIELFNDSFIYTYIAAKKTHFYILHLKKKTNAITFSFLTVRTSIIFINQINWTKKN